MKRILALCGGILLICGVLIMAIFFIWPDNEFTVIEAHEITYWATYKWKFYTFDIYRYIRSIETSVDPRQLFGLIPNFPSLPTWNPKDLIAILNYIAKVLAVFIPNILIFFANILLWPIKLIIYPVHIFGALVGIDMNNVDAFKSFEQIWALQIPMIPYW